MAYSAGRSKRRTSRAPLVFGLLLSVVAVGGYYGVQQWKGPLSADFESIEREPPKATWRDLPKGLPGDKIELTIDASDEGSGLGRIVATVEQNELKAQLLDLPFEGASVKQSTVRIPIEARKLGLKEGDAVVTATVSDSTVWSNSSTVQAKLRVNFTRSRVEVLSTQQNGSVGGVELVLFRMVGHALEKGGAQVGSVTYESYPLATFDPSLSIQPGLYGSLFPIRYDFKPETERISLVVTDEFGTVLTAPFNYRIARKWKFPEVDMKLSDQFVNTKVPELLEALKQRDPSIVPSGDNFADFKLINENLRRLNEAQIQEVLRTSPVKERLWSGVFIRPLAAAPKATFAEKRLYKHGNATLSESLHMGIDLADVVQATVRAANRGQVVFVGELGIYGQTVIIDHGTGVSSLYGHLSAISVNQGDVFPSGHEIGKTGATGLAGGDHLHFEIRVQGVPVSPFEWWDPLWIREHVEEKIKSVIPAELQQPKPAVEAP